MPQVLVIEDETRVLRSLEEGLRAAGFEVKTAATGDKGARLATAQSFDCIVLDWMLPGLDGIQILSNLRRSDRTTPVLLLTARDAIEDRVLGLDSGADDYLVKPFALEELLARVRALLRRGPRGSDGLLRHGALVLDPPRREVRLDGRPLPLTAKEYQVLHLLMSDPGRVFSRAEIEERIYDDAHESQSNTVDVFLSRLRRKLGNASPLRTVRGAGYSLRGEEE